MRAWWTLVVAGCGPVSDAPDLCLGIDVDGDGVCDADAVDWSADASLPEEGHRRDVYGLGDALDEVAAAGVQHAFVWPVEVSGMLLPYRPMVAVLEDTDNPQAVALQAAARTLLGFGNLEEMYDWLGLPRVLTDEGPYAIDLPEGAAVGDALGAGVVDTELGGGLTFSCAACHVSEFFGHTVVGMTNRETRANEFFLLGQLFYGDLDASFFQSVTGATEDELVMFTRTQQALPAVGVKLPEVQGLDTALAQVALSLARRAPDAWATRSLEREQNPEPVDLDVFVGDSKPAVWWTLKYKTRWLSDGSILSGNPVHTNFLWNEIGRGTDLHALKDWMIQDRRAVEELTAAVFATDAPRWTDFFPFSEDDLAAARRGEQTFEGMCASCHGSYDKAWEQGADLPARVATTRVRYHAQTPVMDVGTDPQRAQAMSRFADGLNQLDLSRWMGTVVEVQQGYVPPPLEGVWARYPYLHNGSVPTLCDLLRPAEGRVTAYWAGPARDPETDFDADCVGYPTGDAVPPAWRDEPRRYFDASLPGLRNVGHDAMLLDAHGDPVLSDDEVRDLIAFLKTL